MPLAWVDEPTAPGAPDLYASWPGMPGVREPDQRAAPGSPLHGDRLAPGRDAARPDGLGPAAIPMREHKTDPGRPRNPAMPPDPRTDPGRAPNPAMPPWDLGTDPGRAPNPAMPPDPRTDPGRAPNPAMPPDSRTDPGRLPNPAMPPDPRTDPGRLPNPAMPRDPRTDPGRAQGPGWEDRSGAPARPARGGGQGRPAGQGAAWPPVNGGLGNPEATMAPPAEAFWEQGRGPRPLPAPPRARIAYPGTARAGTSGQATWPPGQAPPPDPGMGAPEPEWDPPQPWGRQPPRRLLAPRPAAIPGPAGSQADAWLPGDDEAGLWQTRVDRFGDGRGRPARSRPKAGFWAEVPLLVVAAVVLAVLVKGFLVQAFYIPSRSMEPTLDVGDRVVVNRLSYRFGAPKRGQVVVFLRRTGDRQAAPENPLSWVRRAVAQGFGGAPPGSEDLIKRVIAGPGDVVRGSKGRVWVNGRALDEPYLRRGSFTSDFGPVQIPPGHYWVMGDNREDSSDSRVFGPIPRSALVGHAVGTVWPPTRLRHL